MLSADTVAHRSGRGARRGRVPQTRRSGSCRPCPAGRTTDAPHSPNRRPSSVPARTMVRPSRAAAVKDGPAWGRPKGLSLYGAFEVKLFSRLHFLHSSFFVRLGIPFLRPDPHMLEAAAHRGCQGRPSLCPGGTLRRFQAGLDRPEHGGRLVVVGMTRPRGARCRGTGNSRRNLVSGGS